MATLPTRKKRTFTERSVSDPAGVDGGASLFASTVGGSNETSTSESPVRRTASDGNQRSKRTRHDWPALDTGAIAEVFGNSVNRWPRGEAPSVDPRTDTLAFQNIDIDDTIEEARAGPWEGATRGPVPVLRVFGVNQDGTSICAHVHGFHPYLYLPAPPNFDPDDCEAIRRVLNTRLESEVRQNARAPQYVLAVDVVQRETLVGYHGGRKHPFIQVTVALHSHVATLRRVLEKGVSFGPYGEQAFQTYESNIGIVLRFMIDVGIVGMGWLEAPAGTYQLRAENSQTTYAQVEIDISYTDLVSHLPDTDEWSAIAPIRICSFDIECAGRKGIFPEAEIDPVIQIANAITVQGETTPRFKNVFVLNSCAPISGAKVYSFETERELLQAWALFVQAVDPDILTGYNIINFDLPYLLDRARELGVTNFPYLGRVRGNLAKMKDTVFQSKAFGKRASKDITIDGRIQLDMLKVIQRDYKLRSYTLNAVSAHFLGEQKEDVHHSIITDLHNGTEETRRRLAVYCLKDALLPQRLLDKLMCMYNYIEMARVTGVPLNFLFTRGQQVKVVSQLYRKANSLGLIVPAYRSQQQDDGVQYEGATVIEPLRGFYDEPVTTLDFSSLYPSIMMAHNLCYSTLLAPQNASKLDSDDYIRTPSGALFVKETVRKGVLPVILEELLAARKRAKADLKREKDPFKRAVLDGRQLALKISANSVYGFTGATVGKLPCLEISGSVTAFGRLMIEQTKTLVEEKYTVANGYDHDAVVIYGDTDSVMIKFGQDDVGASMDLGREAADYVNTHFIRPINLEFEKVYFPYLLINKKRYAGMYWTKPETYDKMDAKGIETVRRDNSPLVKNLIGTCLEKILKERNVDGAIDHVKLTISRLLQNKIDLSELVISKSLSKAADEYDNKQAHVELAQRMRERDAGSAPSMGDRVAYVIVQGAKGAKAYEKAEDPIYVLEHNLSIDTKYYLHQQLKKPLLRIFEPILGDDANSLFSGAHTRTIFKRTPTQGGIMRFAVKTKQCLACRTPIPDEDSRTVCDYCKDHEVEIYQKAVLKVSHLERKFAQLWTQCQSCQGSMHQDVLCTSKDCPMFYMRTRVRMDLQDAQTTLDRFNYDW